MLLAYKLDPIIDAPTGDFSDIPPICDHPLAGALDTALLDSNLSLRDRRRIAAVDLDVLAEEVDTAVLHGLRPTPVEILRLADLLTHDPAVNQPAVHGLPRDPQPEAAAWALGRMAG